MDDNDDSGIHVDVGGDNGPRGPWENLFCIVLLIVILGALWGKPAWW